jgi:hypothetical protein
MILAPMAAPPGSSAAIAVRPLTARARTAPARFARLAGVAEAAGLAPPQRGVVPPIPQQLAVRALLHDATALEHNEAVHLGDGRQAMRDGNHGLAGHERGKARLDGGLDFAVERGGRLVKHENRRVLENDAGDRNALALTAGQFDPALTDMGLKAPPPAKILKLGNELARVRELGSRDDLRLGGVRPAIADVVANGAVQQRGVLGDDRDLRPQALLGHVGDILAVDEDPAALEIKEAQQKIDQGRFAGARPSHQAALLPGPHLKGQIVDQAALAAIAEANILETDFAATDHERRRVASIGEQDRPGNGAHAFLHHADIFEDRSDILGNPTGHARDLPRQR